MVINNKKKTLEVEEELDYQLPRYFKLLYLNNNVWCFAENKSILVVNSLVLLSFLLFYYLHILYYYFYYYYYYYYDYYYHYHYHLLLSSI